MELVVVAAAWKAYRRGRSRKTVVVGIVWKRREKSGKVNVRGRKRKGKGGRESKREQDRPRETERARERVRKELERELERES